jgi:hypothetical protein
MVYDFDGKPAWLWPHGQIPPSNLSTSADDSHRGIGVRYGLNFSVAEAPDDGTQPTQRCVPPTRYSDVLGQNPAVEAARDLIELPLKHADIFLRIGAKPLGHGEPRLGRDTAPRPPTTPPGPWSPGLLWPDRFGPTEIGS